MRLGKIYRTAKTAYFGLLYGGGGRVSQGGGVWGKGMGVYCHRNGSSPAQE